MWLQSKRKNRFLILFLTSTEGLVLSEINKMRPVILAFLTTASILASDSCAVVTFGAEISLKSLREEIIKNRNQITKMEVLYHVERVVEDPKIVSPSLGYSMSKRVWFDEQRLRSDLLLDEKNGIIRTKCLNCYVDNTLVSTTSERISGKNVIPSIYAIEYTSKADAIPDPRWLGLFPVYFDVASRYKIDSVFTAKNPESVHIEEGIIKGIECKIITWDILYPPITYRCWRTKKSSLVIPRIEASWINGNQQVVESIEMDYEKMTDLELEYPTNIRFEQRYDNDLVVFEVTKINVVSVNKPIDPAIFTLKNMPGVNKGIPIQWVSDETPPAPVPLIWDGSKIISATPDVIKEPLTVTKDRLLLRNIIVFGNLAIICIVIAVILFRRAYSR